MGEVEQQHVRAGVAVQVVEHGVDPLHRRVDPSLDPAQKVDPIRGGPALVGRREGVSRGRAEGAEHVPGQIPPAVVDLLLGALGLRASGPDSSCSPAAPSRRDRRLRSPSAGQCRAAQSAPFFWRSPDRPAPEPSLLLAPRQPLLDEDLGDAAALHPDPFPQQVGHQAIQRPRREGQAQLRGRGQGGVDYGAALGCGVGGRAPRPHVLLQTIETAGLEALEPVADSFAAQVHAL